jgi:hypothetical protein
LSANNKLTFKKMKQTMTGGCGLSRKLLTVMLLSFATISGAQTATGPNKVYIEQVGSSNTITIEQVGGTNNVGGVTTTVATAVAGTGITTLTPDAPSATNYGTITGSTNIVDITQTGNANSSQYNIRGSNNSYTTNMLGNGNQTRLTIGNPNAATNSQNVITEQIIGNNNMIIQELVGSNIITDTHLVGNDNQVTSSLLSNKGNVSNVVTGNANVFNIQQLDAAGANGHVLAMMTTGDYNSITTQQQGTNDTTVNIQTQGSNNTITVRTSSTTIASPATAIAR